MIYDKLLNKETKLSVIGLGYVGLPIALEFAKQIKVTGFDIKPERVELMRKGIDPSNELAPEAFDNADIFLTSDPSDLKEASFHIIAVPTPTNRNNLPDLTPVLKASETVGRILKKGDYVVYESTVYPGCTEEDCVPVLERYSGLKYCTDFKVGFSPERINPGDQNHTLTKITKVTSGCDEESAENIARVYELVIKAGVHRASSIKVAEAAKIIENTQRDINIAFMNELSIIFNKMGINTYEVLEAASTKWNFLRFEPGLVGGHCIPVDPYYLAHKALEVGYVPHLILAGRRINEEMANYVAEETIKLLIKSGKRVKGAKVALLGIAFKENVPDVRNSKVYDLYRKLKDFDVEVYVYDPIANAEEVIGEYGIKLIEDLSAYAPYDAIVLAVRHNIFLENLSLDKLKAITTEPNIIVDVKGVFEAEEARKKGFVYWRLNVWHNWLC